MKRLVAYHCLLFVLFFPAAASAQTSSATLSGTVLDPQNLVVPNTRISAENVATGIVLTTISNEAGIYLFPSIPPAIYRLTGEAPGFRKQVFNDVTVAVGAKMNINFFLQLGAAEDAVEVTAPAESLLTGTEALIDFAEVRGQETGRVSLLANHCGLINMSAGGCRAHPLSSDFIAIHCSFSPFITLLNRL